MYKDVLRSITDIEIFPVISLTIFMVFFAGLIVFVLRMSKSHIQHMEELPCQSDEETLRTLNTDVS